MRVEVEARGAVGDEERVLRNDVEAGADSGAVESGEVGCVDSDAAVREGEHLQESHNEGSFAAAGGAADGDFFARVDRKGEVFEDWGGGWARD